MAPKQVQISELGAPAQSRNGWRAQAKIDRIVVFGPQRATKKEAWADVALARQSTSREAYARCLQEMRAAVKKEQPVKEEPVDDSPDDPAPQASAASSSAQEVETTSAEAKRRKTQHKQKPADPPQHADMPGETVETPSALPAEVVETRSAATGAEAKRRKKQVTQEPADPPQDVEMRGEIVETPSAADVSLPKDDFHSAAEENDLPEEDVEMTHGAAEDDDPPEEEFHSAAGSSRDDVSMPEEEFHSAAGSSRDDAGVQGSGGCTTFSQWMRMRMASEATEGPITYLQLEERLVHELVEILELEVPDESWKRVPAHVKLFVLVGVCRHQGKLDAREEAFLSDVEGYCFEEVDRVTVDLFSYVFSLTSDDGSTYDDSSWPELIREMPNGLLNSFLGIAASFLCTDSLEDFQAIGRYCRNSSRSIRRRGKNADSAHICSPDAAVETPGATPSHQPQTSQDAETTRPQQDEVHASDEDADSAESSSPAEVAETPSSLDSGSKRPRRE